MDAESGVGYFKENRSSGSFQERVWMSLDSQGGVIQDYNAA